MKNTKFPIKSKEDLLASIEDTLDTQKINDTPAVRLALAKDYYKLGNYEEALIRCNQAIDLSSAYIWPHMTKIKVLNKLGEAKEALSLIDTVSKQLFEDIASARKVEFVEIYLSKVISLYELGKKDEALNSYTTLIKCFPDCKYHYSHMEKALQEKQVTSIKEFNADYEFSDRGIHLYAEDGQSKEELYDSLNLDKDTNLDALLNTLSDGLKLTGDFQE